jgi:hypothetical protein
MKLSGFLSTMLVSALFTASALASDLNTTETGDEMAGVDLDMDTMSHPNLRALTYPYDAKYKINSWWKWNRFYKAPRKESAFTTEACIEDYEDQPVKDYFFLAGYDNKVCNGKAYPRTCETVSKYDTILIPVVTALCSSTDKKYGYKYKKHCKEMIDRYDYSDLYAKYDGKHYAIQRIPSPYEFTYGSSKYYSDGYWVVIPYPTKGKHTLEVGVYDYDVLRDYYSRDFCPNVKYTLYVK